LNGRHPVREAVERFSWSSSSRAGHAATFARALDLLPRHRSPTAWSSLVCTLAAIFYDDLCPLFARVRLRSVRQGLFFPVVPFKGRHGWRVRARVSGLLDNYVD
jgi:hypothetical protein